MVARRQQHRSRWPDAAPVIDTGTHADFRGAVRQERRELFAGDFIYPGGLYAFLPGASRSAYLATTRTAGHDRSGNAVIARTWRTIRRRSRATARRRRPARTGTDLVGIGRGTLASSGFFRAFSRCAGASPSIPGSPGTTADGRGRATQRRAEEGAAGSPTWSIIQVLNVVAFTWIGTAAQVGASHLVFWLLGIALFYIPSGIVVAHLAREMPLEGGLYQWAKLRFGSTAGFLVVDERLGSTTCSCSRR